MHWLHRESNSWLYIYIYLYEHQALSQANWHNGNALDWLWRLSVRIPSWTLVILIEVFFLPFSRGPGSKFQRSISIRPLPFPSRSFPVYNSRLYGPNTQNKMKTGSNQETTSRWRVAGPRSSRRCRVAAPPFKSLLLVTHTVPVQIKRRTVNQKIKIPHPLSAVVHKTHNQIWSNKSCRWKPRLMSIAEALENFHARY
jgi:hypothetical protein